MLELEDLHRRYGATVALAGLDMTVPDGTMYGFLGPNGAGKTTAMRAMFGVTSLDRGEIRWNGIGVDFELTRTFGYAPEERGLYGRMRVLDHLTYLGRLHGLSRRDAERRGSAWLERLGLADRRDDNVDSLSLGNQQRVQLAAAMLHEPPLLVLDEPFSGLDPVAVDEIAGTLRGYVADGRTVVFSSHQLDLVEALCDAATIIDHGRALLSGTVAELGTIGGRRLVVRIDGHPSTAWTADVRGVTVEGERADGAVQLRLDASADVQAVLAAALRAGPVSHFVIEQRRLSEVFRSALAAQHQEPAGVAQLEEVA